MPKMLQQRDRVCVCVCARARACVYVYVRVRACVSACSFVWRGGGWGWGCEYKVCVGQWPLHECVPYSFQTSGQMTVTSPHILFAARVTLPDDQRAISTWTDLCRHVSCSGLSKHRWEETRKRAYKYGLSPACTYHRERNWRREFVAVGLSTEWSFPALIIATQFS